MSATERTAINILILKSECSNRREKRRMNNKEAIQILKQRSEFLKDDYVYELNEQDYIEALDYAIAQLQKCNSEGLSSEGLPRNSEGLDEKTIRKAERLYNLQYEGRPMKAVLEWFKERIEK